jgi:hypothetical protein
MGSNSARNLAVHHRFSLKTALRLAEQRSGMMRDLNVKGKAAVDGAAARQGIDHDAALILFESLAKGGGHHAQFNHPGLGGMGQWSQGAMAMIGDMSNNDLKHRLDALCVDFTAMLADDSNFSDHPMSRTDEQQGREPAMRPVFFQKPPVLK